MAADFRHSFEGRACAVENHRLQAMRAITLPGWRSFISGCHVFFGILWSARRCRLWAGLREFANAAGRRFLLMPRLLALLPLKREEYFHHATPMPFASFAATVELRTLPSRRRPPAMPFVDHNNGLYRHASGRAGDHTHAITSFDDKAARYVKRYASIVSTRGLPTAR